MKIVIWTGPAWETWGPMSVVNGIGGSETAAIQMATQLSVLGHDVAIVGQVEECTFLQVRYIKCGSAKEFPDEERECDVFISSRDRSAVRQVRPKAKLTVLWMHDLHMGEDALEEMLDFDRIFVLSKYALQYALGCYPHVPESKYFVTRNGISPPLFLRVGESLDDVRPVVKQGCKAIYSSSYDRGLDRLLTMWPKIRKMEPEAELHVYYGFNTAEKQAEAIGRISDRLTLDFFKARLASMADLGVVSHGRVGQRELARAFLDSALWLYPTNFHETSCITAMEAQAAGAYAVTSNLAALPETLRMGYFVEPPNVTDEYEEVFLEGVADFLEKREVGLKDNLHRNRKWIIENRSWALVAREWDNLFNKLLSERVIHA
jgi:glycosyltransferase involved in cell wall biosynthesis